ncbi:MAG TPA: urease accessory protein UreF [Stellaceae bacterium]|nr:urease accessory protein UreF [Stellaceae bacterium]
MRRMGPPPVTAIRMMMAEEGLYHLLSWLSPAYPVGAFAHSSGLEWAIGAGWVDDRRALEDWLGDVLTRGAGWNDAVLVTAAHRAASASDRSTLVGIAELAAAAHPSHERRIESLAQGDAFRRIASATLPENTTMLLDDIAEGEIAYPIAVATLAAGHGIGLAATLTAYLHGMVGNLVSAGQRLIPLGQTDGQTAIMTLKPVVLATVQRAITIPVGDPFPFLGSATLTADLASMWHETQYTRLFRT